MNQQTSSRKESGEEHWVWRRALNLFHYIYVICDMHHTRSCLSIYLSIRTEIEGYFSSQIAPITVICPAWHIFSANICNEIRCWQLLLDAGSANWHWKNSQAYKGWWPLSLYGKKIPFKVTWNFSPNNRGRLRNSWMEVTGWPFFL